MLELPKEFGVVWVVGLLTGVYGGIASFFSIIEYPENFTVAQVTILSILMLIAHALPTEAKITKFLGVNYWYAIIFRFTLSIIFAFLLSVAFSSLGLLQEKIHVVDKIAFQHTNSYLEVITTPITISAKVGLIIIILHILIEFLKKIKIIYYLELMLSPITYILKFNNKLSSSLLVGLLLGISYGGALLMKDFDEIKSVNFRGKKKVIYFLNLVHSLVEDTILVLLINANLFVVLIGRILFSILILMLLNIYWGISESNVDMTPRKNLQ